MSQCDNNVWYCKEKEKAMRYDFIYFQKANNDGVCMVNYLKLTGSASTSTIFITQKELVSNNSTSLCIPILPVLPWASQASVEVSES